MVQTIGQDERDLSRIVFALRQVIDNTNSASTTAAAGDDFGKLLYVSTTALSFTPFAGNVLRINGADLTIPSAGIAGLANTSVFVNGTGSSNLAASTFYYVYAFVNGSTVTADFTTTGHATSSTSGNQGVEIQNGDDTRSLIDMIRTNGSSQFVDAAQQRFVRSWFNRNRSYVGPGTFTQDRFTTSLTSVEINSEMRCEFLIFSDEVIFAKLAVGVTNSIGTNGFSMVNFDGGTSESTGSFVIATNWTTSAALRTDLSEGYHYVTMFGRTLGGTQTYYNDAGGSTSNIRSALTGIILR